MKSWVQAASRRTLLNGVAVFGGEALSRLATFLMALIVARRFGAAALGQYGYALAVASLLQLVPDLGLHLLTMRELAAEPGRLRALFWSLHWLKLLLVGAVVIFTVTFGALAVQDGGRGLLLDVLVARVLLQTFSQAYMAIFKAFERMHYIVVQQLISAALALAWVAAALALGASLGVVVSALIVGEAAEAWLGWRIIHTRFSPGRRYPWDSKFLKTLLLASLPIGITAILQTLDLRLDVLTLSLFVPNRELGNFQAAAWFPVGTFLAASLLMTVLFPKLSRLLRTPSERSSAYVGSLLKNGILLTSLASLAVWAGAPRLLRMLFGPELVPAASTLRILAATLPFVFLNTALFYVFIAAQQRTLYLCTLTFGVGVGAVLGLGLAARYGAPGAALADLAREFVVSVVYLGCLVRGEFARRAGLALLRVFLGTATLAALAILFKGPGALSVAWLVTWTVLVISGTLVFLGLPRLQELLLLTDDRL